MATFLTGGTLLEFEPPSVEVANLRIEDGKIVARGPSLGPVLNDEVIDLNGKLVMPGLVSAHHRMHTALLRGLPPKPFAGEQALIRSAEDALDLDGVQAVTTSAALEGLVCGTTTVFNSHASPKAISGSLRRVAQGLSDVGLRAVLAYQVSERHGPAERDEAINECFEFAQRAKGRFRGAMGAQTLATLSDDALTAIREARERIGGVSLFGLGEDPLEERTCQERFGMTGPTRLLQTGLITDKTALSHLIHLAWPDLAPLLGTGAYLVHCARANMQSQGLRAAAAKFGVHACLGTDTQPLDVLTEAQTAFLRAREASQPVDVLRFIANGHRFASRIFGARIGPLREGALADLVILDYRALTPLTAETLAGHLVHGISAQHVEAVMVDGIWRLWARKPLAIDPKEVSARCSEVAKAIWARMVEAEKAHAAPAEHAAAPEPAAATA